jgi:hypothetical protein
MKLTPEQQSKVDRIQEMRREIREVEETLPDPFDFFDNDGNFVAKKDDFIKATMRSILKNGKISYVLLAEDKETIPAEQVFGNNTKLHAFWNWTMDNEYIAVVRIGASENWSITTGIGVYRDYREYSESLSKLIAALMCEWLQNHKRK